MFLRPPLLEPQEAPSFSGRVERFVWRAHRRVRVAAGSQAGGGGTAAAHSRLAPARPAPATQLNAFAASLPGASTEATPRKPAPDVEKLREYVEEPEDSSSGAAAGGYDGRPRAGKKKPLKINLDLALWRARQTRMEANRSQDAGARRTLLRQAETALRRCLELDPEDGRPYVSLGKIMVQQRRYDEAAKIYEEGSAATGGTNAHIWTAWAYLAGLRGDLALARRLYDAGLVADSSHAAAYHAWGLLEKRQGNYLRARDLWTRGVQATRRNPNPFLYQSLAVLASEMECHEEARKWFRQGTRTLMGSASHALWQAWALMEARLGTEPSIVRRLFARGLEGSPKSRYIHLAWAEWEAETQGEVEAARQLYQQGARLNPRDAALLCAWALLEEKQENIEEARRLFRKGAKADPSHLYVWQGWGVLEFRQGAYEAARELFQQGIWAAPPSCADVCLIFQAWAVLERAAGNISAARQLFKCAVKAEPRSEPSWLAWASMEEDLGAFERGNELRNFSMQERQEIVRPANFTTMPRGADGGRMGALDAAFDRIASWFKARDENTSARGSGSGSAPELLAASGPGRPAQRRPPLLPLSSGEAFGTGSDSEGT